MQWEVKVSRNHPAGKAAQFVRSGIRFYGHEAIVIGEDQVTDAILNEPMLDVVEIGEAEVGEKVNPLDQCEKLPGGYYVLPNGEKVKGKAKALAALEALNAEPEEANNEEEELSDEVIE